MVCRPLLLLSLALVCAAPSQAQPDAELDAPARTAAETAVQATIAADGVHVVHFWAAWCGNSMNELRAGLWRLIDEHPDVTFTFVAYRNQDDGAETLARFGLPERVTVLHHPRRDGTFLDLPVSWTPTTWVFNRGGKLAYAFNYGELSAPMLTQALADARDDWHHD